MMVARHIFPPDLFFYEGSNNAVVLGALAAFRVWTARTGGTDVTASMTQVDGVSALTTNGSGAILADADGIRPWMTGPDAVGTIYIDVGVGDRYPVHASDMFAPLPVDTTSAATYASGLGVVDAAAFEAAVAAVPAGGTLFLPKALTYTIERPLAAIIDINITSDGAAINFASDAGAGTYAMTISSSSSYPLLYIENLFVTGPGTRGALGTSPCNMHGILLSGSAKPQFRNVTVRLFNRGVDMNTTTGHLHFSHINFTDNFYGAYLTHNSSDYFFKDSELNGNLFAGLGMPADQGFDGLVIENSHIGFQPYGIFQENAPAAQGSPKVFLQDALFEHARFESIGNGAIVSEATTDASNKSSFNSVRIVQPGFSWNATYKIAARAKPYAIDVGFMERIVEIESGVFPFTAGATGVYHIDQADSNGFIILRGTASQVSGTQVTVDSGNPTIVAGGAPLMLGTVAMQQYNTGDYYTAPAARSTATRPNDTLTYVPIRIDRVRTFTGLAVEVTIAGNAGATCRLGVYSPSTTTGKPSALVLDAGSVVADATGVKTITGLTLALTPGWYYLAANVQNAPTVVPQFRAFTSASAVPGAPVYSPSTSLASGAGFSNVSSNSGALPASASANPTDTTILVALIA